MAAICERARASFRCATLACNASQYCVLPQLLAWLILPLIKSFCQTIDLVESSKLMLVSSGAWQGMMDGFDGKIDAWK